VSTRWAGTALCTLAVAAAALLGMAGAGAVDPSARPAGSERPLTLLSQTPWVTPTQPWFNIALGVGSNQGDASTLRVSLTFYGRMVDASQLQQAIAGAPTATTLLRDSDVPVVAGPSGLTASACVTVVPNANASPPASGPSACGAGSSETLVLGCRPGTGVCGDVYPVVVSLLRQGSSTALARFTTFVTYQEPDATASVGRGGQLRVGVVVPVTPAGAVAVTDALAAHKDVPTTLAVAPTAVNALEQAHTRDGLHALSQLADLGADEVLDQSLVPVNLAALSEAGLAGEITAQLGRGDEVLRAAGLKPTGGPWVDTASNFAQGDAGNLASGLQVAGSSQLVLNGGDLSAGGLSNYTFAQPFTLDLGHGSTVPAAAANGSLSNRFTAQPADPVLGAEQLLASLSFVHFENAFLSQARGVVVTPPAGWHPSGTFIGTLLGGLSGNPALRPVTLDQLFAQVPAGGNREPAVRQLQAGPAGHGISRGAADRIALARQQLSSYTAAVPGRPPVLTTLNDALLATEARGLRPVARTAALTAYDAAFAGQTGHITLATERTVTFTAQRAAIPVTVLSGSPYPVSVVVTLTSDKFTFPDGNTRQLLLDRPTTSVRVTAQARTSGDRLPIDVTLHTPDGQLVLGHAVLTVQSTAISFVGVALTALAGAVLLAWWVRTWRRSRRARPRAH
jgi:hypothetical protein